MSDRFTITLGERTFVCTNGRTKSTLNGPDTASGIVAADDLAERGADWSGPAHATIEDHDMMHGVVVKAEPQEDGTVALSLRGATVLEESLLPPMVVQQIDGREVVYLAAREAGFDPDDINIHGFPEAIAFEPLWVLAPIRGLVVQRTVMVGVVELIDGDSGREMLRRFVPTLEPQFIDPLADVTAFARVAMPVRYLYEAEQEGLRLIDVAAAWLTTRLRYSWSHAPDGRPDPYERAATLVVVERAHGVAVFPVDRSGRRWWRDTTPARREEDVEFPPDARWLNPPMPTQVSSGDRQALVALQRAITNRDPVQRVVAFWEAIEFYVGDYKPGKQFTRSECAAIVARACEGLPEAKAERVKNLLQNQINNWSILARFERVLEAEGVPYTEEDKRRVKEMREARDRGVHGSNADASHADRPGSGPHEPGDDDPLEPLRRLRFRVHPRARSIRAWRRALRRQTIRR